MTTTADSRAVLESLGLRPIINGVGAASRLGGTILSEEVRAAMDAAAQHCVPLSEMQARASEVISEITGAEAGCVASGAAACLFLGTAACMVRSDLAAMDRLPDTTGLRNEVVLHRAHRNPYDHALRATGARLVEFGYVGAVSGVGTYEWQLRAALTSATAAIYYFPNVRHQVLDLVTVVRIARAEHVPVIVDGSALADLEQLRGYLEIGADLVAVSGGKFVAGPAGTGFLAGRLDLVRSATVQQQDLFVHPDLWSAPLGTDPGDGHEPPHQGAGRTMKVGREEIAGLLVALKLFARRDVAAEKQRWTAMCERIESSLPDADGVRVEIRQNYGVPEVVLSLGGADHARRIAQSLEDGEPRIFVRSMAVHQAELVISPYSIRDDEVQPLIERLVEVLSIESDRECAAGSVEAELRTSR